jgi:mono/diheme cytochrome c family protein
MSDDARKPDWRSEAERLASRYALVTGAAVTFVLFGLIVTPALLRERRAPPEPPSDQPAAASVGWLDQAEAPPSKGRDLPPIDPATVMTANPTLLARGEALFKQNCSSCHGDGGHGDGPASGTLNPKPRNFAAPDKWTRGFRVADIFATITTGSKGTAMAAFDFIPPADRMALVHYVRSLGAFDHGAEDAKALAALADSFRTKGVHIPNRIPASLAMRKLVAEQAPAPALPAAAETSELVRRVVRDRTATARTVAATAKLGDVAAVARAWTAGVPDNGFATALVSLDVDEWHALVTLLLGKDLPMLSSMDGGTP